eukprot:5055670-Amphidinium_carterae.1
MCIRDSIDASVVKHRSGSVREKSLRIRLVAQGSVSRRIFASSSRGRKDIRRPKLMLSNHPFMQERVGDKKFLPGETSIAEDHEQALLLEHRRPGPRSLLWLNAIRCVYARARCNSPKQPGRRIDRPSLPYFSTDGVFQGDQRTSPRLISCCKR